MQRTDKIGRPWIAPKPYQGCRPGGIATRAQKSIIPKLDPAKAANRTDKSQIYWTAHRAGQVAKREAGIPYTPPGWLGARKQTRQKRRQWMPGEHKKPK